MQHDFHYRRDHLTVWCNKEIRAKGEQDINRDFGYCLGMFRVISVMVRGDSFMVQVKILAVSPFYAAKLK